MESWRLKLDENSIYQGFFYLYNQGDNPVDISKQLQSDFDDDTINECFFALALAQWETKSLSKTIFKKVKKIIETDADIKLLRSHGVDEKELQKRKKELGKFLAKLSIEREKAKPRKKYQRNKLGNVYAIPLPNGKFGFCRSFREGAIAVYQHIGDSMDDLPKSEEYQFTIGVDRWVLTCCDWPIVENCRE